MQKITMPALLLGLAAALAVALIACDRVEAQDRTFNLEIADSKLVAGNPPLQVNEDDYVEIAVSSDRPVSFHLHGYDIEVKAGPGQPATLAFTANATGSFPFTIHEEGAEEDDDGSGDADDRDESGHRDGREDGDGRGDNDGRGGGEESEEAGHTEESGDDGGSGDADGRGDGDGRGGGEESEEAGHTEESGDDDGAGDGDGGEVELGRLEVRPR